MHMLGGANWWLPAWLDRILPRFSIEAPEDGAERAPEPEPVSAAHDVPATMLSLPAQRTAEADGDRTGKPLA
jgi:RND superfamily putative drug exporter